MPSIFSFSSINHGEESGRKWEKVGESGRKWEKVGESGEEENNLEITFLLNKTC